MVFMGFSVIFFLQCITSNVLRIRRFFPPKNNRLNIVSYQIQDNKILGSVTVNITPYGYTTI